MGTHLPLWTQVDACHSPKHLRDVQLRGPSEEEPGEDEVVDTSRPRGPDDRVHHPIHADTHGAGEREAVRAGGGEQGGPACDWNRWREGVTYGMERHAYH